MGNEKQSINSQCKCKGDSQACPTCVHLKVKRLVPGDKLVLQPGVYNTAVSIDGIRGTKDQPIEIVAENSPIQWEEYKNHQTKTKKKNYALFRGAYTRGSFRVPANVLSRKKQAQGGFPGLYYVADEAMLRVQNCQHIFIRGLCFENCWPTGIYLDNCQDIEIARCNFLEGTIAIGAFGNNTRHLKITKCNWQQNTGNSGNWEKITWKQIHGHLDSNGVVPVNTKDDWRMYDGDFFRGWDIAGFVTISQCVVEDAFNAIHLFNNISGKPSTGLNRNVLVENCEFLRIRDNAIEPENAAWNWVIRHNRFVDVYRIFSLEMQRSGHFYIYGNLFWHTQKPGGGNDQGKESGSIFKFSNKEHTADGPHYVFHNSFLLREKVAKKRRFSGLKFFNNAAHFCADEKAGCHNNNVLFASSFDGAKEEHNDSWPVQKQLEGEKKRFTKAWEVLEIEIHDCVFENAGSFSSLNKLGYAFERVNNAPVGFRGPFAPSKVGASSMQLKVGDSSNSVRAKACKFELQTPGWQTVNVVAGGDIGAFQADGTLFDLPVEFEWQMEIDDFKANRDPAYPQSKIEAMS